MSDGVPDRTETRVATDADAARVTEIFVESFFEDPVWSWVFADSERRREQYEALWGLFVDGAIPHGWVWLAARDAAAALWLPPGMPELSPPEAARLEPMLREMLGDGRAELVLRTFERFDEAQPPGPPHYYLSLLGTHPDHRGRGIGMGLLADNLAVIDDLGAPAYLESTNPVNHARYERVGFTRLGGFELPEGGPPVATMWREPGG